VVALALELADNSDRNDDFMLFEAVEGGGVGEQDARIQDVSLSYFRATTGQLAPLPAQIFCFLALTTLLMREVGYWKKVNPEGATFWRHAQVEVEVFYFPSRRSRTAYERSARRKSTFRKSGQYASQK
jgi:hypothetical protein